MKNKTDILIIAAMEEEVLPLKKFLHLHCREYRKVSETLSYYFFDSTSCEGRYSVSENTSVSVLITGVGITNVTRSMIKFTKGHSLSMYDLIINLGTVGARGCYKIGDILKVSKCYNGDMDLSIFGYDKYEVPGIGKYLKLGEGEICCITMSKFLTSSSLVEGFKDYIVDMELYGLVSFLDSVECCTPIESYKVVTDTSDGESSRREHEENLRVVSKDLCSYILDKLLLEG